MKFYQRAAPSRPIDIESLPPSTLLDHYQAADVLGARPGTLAVWRTTGRYNLPFVKIGHKVKYRAGDLRAFIERRTRGGEGGRA